LAGVWVRVEAKRLLSGTKNMSQRTGFVCAVLNVAVIN